MSGGILIAAWLVAGCGDDPAINHDSGGRDANDAPADAIADTLDVFHDTSRDGDEGGAAIAPWIEEDFSSYASTADLLADRRGVYSVAEDVATNQMFLDTTTGVESLGLTRSMRYDYLAPGCSSQTVGRNLVLPASAAEVWVELHVKLSRNFSVANIEGCATPPSFKFLFGRLTPDGWCRFSLGVLGPEQRWALAAAGCSNTDDFPPTPSATEIYDERWHSIRVHWRVGTPDGQNSAVETWIDGTSIYRRSDFDAGGTPSIYGLALGRNLDQGIPTGTMSLWWGRVRVWNEDPGW